MRHQSDSPTDSDSSCFNKTYDQLVNRMEPKEDDVERALGSANDAFPHLLPKVFNKYRDLCRQMAERLRAANQPLEEEQEEEEEKTRGTPSKSLLKR